MAAPSDLPFWKPPPATTKDLRQFGLLFAVLSAILGGWLLWGPKGYTLPAAMVPFLVSALLGLVSALAPRWLFPAWWPWMVFVRVLGFVNSHLLLAVVFYLLFTPIGRLMRLLGHDPLGDRDFRRARRTVAEGGSLWLRRESTELGAHHYERQF